MRKLSIVIPCRNEKSYIEECIRAIFSAELPADCESNVFVVDGMSDDGTRAVVTELCSEFNNLHLIDNTKQLTPYAFNLGIYAGGKVDFVQIIGARHIISTNYLVRAIEILDSEPNSWCVGGRIINEYTNRTSEIIATAMSTSFGMGIGNFRTLTESGFTDTVTSPMYPYHVFEQIGFFDEELIRNQDDDFNYRVIKAGGKIYFVHDISLKYYVRGNYNGLWRQFFQYGYWKVYVNKKHKAITTIRQMVPALFVLYLGVFILGFFLGIPLITSVPLFIYLVLGLIVSLRNTNARIRFIDLLPVFPLLHLSYGLGYLKGIIDFIIRNQKPSDKQKRMSR
jgi:GT2 family glycosyltransferase